MNVEDILSDLIRIQSVNPPGGETEAALYLKSLFDRQGIPSEIIEPKPGRGSLIAHLGEGDRRLLFLSHLDVVATGEGWSFPPFSGEVRDGFVHGRGALDCKGLAAAQAFAMINLAGTAKLRGKLIFAAAADEEVGSAFGVKYLIENHRDKLAADFAINEGAEMPMAIGGATCHFVGVGEKGPLWVNLRAEGVSAHGSLPMLGSNAVVKMAAAIDKLSRYKPEIVLSPEVKRFLQAVAELKGFREDVTPENVDRLIGSVEDRILAAYLTAITRMTVSPNAVQGGYKTNIVPDRCDCEVDIRVLPGQDERYVLSELSRAIGDIEVKTNHYTPPTFSTADSEAYRLMAETIREGTGSKYVLPFISSGGTDSRYIREMGVPSYGIGILSRSPDPAASQSIHGKDEKVEVEGLRRTATFFETVARKYLAG